MTHLQHKIAPLLLAAALWHGLPAAHAADRPPPHKSRTHTTAPTAPLEGMPEFGVGTHGRFLTLKLPSSRENPIAPNTPYRLFLTGKTASIANTPSGDGILHGVTDAQGRTAWIWTEQPHAAEDFTLIRRIGDGQWGHFFHLHSGRAGEPVPAFPYIMTVRKRWGEQWVDLGYTNAQGDTAYFSHSTPAAPLSLSLEATVIDNRSCFDELDGVNRKLSQNDLEGARAAVAAMTCANTKQEKLDLAQVLLMADESEWAQEVVRSTWQWRFPESLGPMDADTLQSRMELEKLLGMPDEALADNLALQQRAASRKRAATSDDPDWANDIAYYLADFPDYLDEAEEQARRSLRLKGKRPYNQGTLGWILALRGDMDHGLPMMQQAYRDLPRDEEMVADYGLALWRDGQHDQARALWDEAQRQCVWGRRMYDAIREAHYPHPLLNASSSAAVDTYRQRCDAPRTKGKTVGRSV